MDLYWQSARSELIRFHRIQNPSKVFPLKSNTRLMKGPLCYWDLYFQMCGDLTYRNDRENTNHSSPSRTAIKLFKLHLFSLEETFVERHTWPQDISHSQLLFGSSLPAASESIHLMDLRVQQVSWIKGFSWISLARKYKLIKPPNVLSKTSPIWKSSHWVSFLPFSSIVLSSPFCPGRCLNRCDASQWVGLT